MDIKLWYSKNMKQWRWTLLDNETRRQESGQSWGLRDAMDSITVTIEDMIDKHEYAGQDES